MTPQIIIHNESEYALGVKPGKTDVRDYRIACAIPENEFPPEFTLKEIPVKNQGAIPSCVAFASSEVVEMFNQKQTGQYTQFSTDYIYGYRPNDTYQGDGMYLRDACNTLVSKGDLTYVEFPGNHNVKLAKDRVDHLSNESHDKAYPNRVSSYFGLNSTAEIKFALMNYGPVMVSMNIYNKYTIDENYIYCPDYDAGVSGGHAVLIYGWNDLGWIVQNSWGNVWGHGGKFIIPFDFTLNEAYGFTDDIENDDVIRPYKTFIGKLYAIILNFFINHFKRREK